jgi:5'-3' exonuclease
MAGANVDELVQVKGISDEKAIKLIESAMLELKKKEENQEIEEKDKDEEESEEDMADGKG